MKIDLSFLSVKPFKVVAGRGMALPFRSAGPTLGKAPSGSLVRGILRHGLCPLLCGLMGSAGPVLAEEVQIGPCNSQTSTTIIASVYYYGSQQAGAWVPPQQIAITSYTHTVNLANCSQTDVLTLQGGGTETITYPYYTYSGYTCCPVPWWILNQPPSLGSWAYNTVTNVFASSTTFTVQASSLSNVDHYAVYDFGSGKLVTQSAQVSATNASYTLPYSTFQPGSNYFVAASAADGLIQGSFSFQVGSNSLTTLTQYYNWQNDTTNLPGAEIQAVVSSNTVMTFRQYKGGFYALATGTIFNGAPLSSVVYAGLTNSGLGEATLSSANGVLYVTNLSSGGQDGVAFAMPATLTNFVTSFAPLDPSNSLPVGAYIRETLFGQSGNTYGTLGTLTMTKASSNSCTAMVDFSSVETNGYIVQAYSNGVMVAHVTNAPGSIIIFLEPLPDIFDWSSVAVYVDGWLAGAFSVEQPLPGNWQFQSGVTVSATHVLFSPIPTGAAFTNTFLEFTASQIPSLSLTGVAVSPMTLNVAPSNGVMTLDWLGSAALQRSTDLKSWSVIPNASSPYTVPTTGAKAFFRLMGPGE